MGIRDVKQHVPSRDVSIYAKGSPPVVVDIANLLYLVQLRHPVAAFTDEDGPGLIEMRQIFETMRFNRLDFELIFDGQAYAPKQPETERRNADKKKALDNIQAAFDAGGEVALKLYQAAVKATPGFMMKVQRLCTAMGIVFSVAPFEADPQLAQHGRQVISADTDMLALGAREWAAMEPGGWTSGRAKLFIPEEWKSLPVLDLEPYPLAVLSNKWGPAVFRLYAHMRGCDFTAQRSGVNGVGYEGAVKVLESMTEMTAAALAVAIRAPGAVPRLTTPPTVEEVQATVDAFAEAPVYNADGQIVTAAGVILYEFQQQHLEHRAGRRHPKTAEHISEAMSTLLCSIPFSDLTLPSTVRLHEKTRGLLGEGPASASLPSLKAFVSMHGGKTADMRKADMVSLAQMYIAMGEEAEVVLTDRPDLYLKFLKLPDMMKKDLKMGFVLRELLAAETAFPAAVKSLLEEVVQLYATDRVVEDPDEVCTASAEFGQVVWRMLYSALGGDSTHMKAMKDSKSKFTETKITYHAYSAGVADITDAAVPHARHYIISAQQASLTSEPGAKRKDEDGARKAKSDPTRYPVIIELAVGKSANHRSGKVTSIMRSYCFCKDGQQACVHKGMAMEAQMLFWDPSLRTGSDAVTQVLKKWGVPQELFFDGCKPVSNLTCCNVDRAHITKQYRSCRIGTTSGRDYPIFSEEDQQLFDEEMSIARFEDLFDQIALDNGAEPSSSDDDEEHRASDSDGGGSSEGWSP